MPDRAQAGWWLWSPNPLAWVLWPLSLIFCALVWLRRWLYRRQWLKSCALDKPVVVVGNISVGGNGKTPVVHSLVRLLQERGYRPGILTRGYKSDYEGKVILLDRAQVSEQAGDEANMLSELCGCPMAVGADRVAAGRQLLSQFADIDVVLADDGLQHYALQRDIEIIVMREQAMGNGFCLPAGPLREPDSRLADCDLLVRRESDDIEEGFGPCWNLQHPQQTRSLSSFCDARVNALAGIGFPALFFAALREQGLDIDGRGFADHHEFTAADLPDPATPLLVTHKDAVKIRRFAHDNIWVVPLELTLSDALQYRFMNILEFTLNG